LRHDPLVEQDGLIGSPTPPVGMGLRPLSGRHPLMDFPGKSFQLRQFARSDDS
jgi:hypothetical protein